MISNTEIIIRLVLGAILGGIIGFERHKHGRPAGFRTHLLVCVAGVLIMIISEYYHYLSLLDPSYVRVDPARLAAGAITGVGFLGAGVIVKQGMNVQGLTTAACLWIVSAIGLSIGSGLYIAGTASFIITFMALWLLRLFEDRIPALSYSFLTVTLRENVDDEVVTSVLIKNGLIISNISYERDLDKSETILNLTVAFKNGISMQKILNDLSSVRLIRKISIRS